MLIQYYFRAHMAAPDMMFRPKRQTLGGGVAVRGKADRWPAIGVRPFKTQPGDSSSITSESH